MKVASKNNQKQIVTRIYGWELLFWGVIELNFVFLLLNHTPAQRFIFLFICVLYATDMSMSDCWAPKGRQVVDLHPANPHLHSEWWIFCSNKENGKENVVGK